MLELTARHADAWNLAWFGEPNERLATVRSDLAAACAAVGRDPASLDITVGINVRYPDLATDAYPVGTEGAALQGSAAEVAAGLAAHADLGASHIIANLEPATPAAVERFAAAVEAFRAR
jgi:alkanesulfonate monooxygenase SsuD/methylene tetrahydromethanopterin reductase-like flavin-dependent oxidoreductase (luciferase family)